jgi:hydrogenase-4 transcriptional activator
VKKDQTTRENGVVDLENARVRLSARARASANAQNTYESALEEVQLLLDEGRSNEVKIRLTPILSNPKNNPAALAKARCLLSASLEMEGLYKESLDAVLLYEPPEARSKLDSETEAKLRIQIGLAYNYNGNHPKAIGILNAAMRSEAEGGSNTQLADASAALARVYRSINEYKIARDHSQKALEYYRATGNWRGVAEAYFGIALADTCEGAYESGLENFGQAIKLVGDRPACHLLGKIYANMAGACWFLKRPHEGIHHLEKAISYYERTEHKANAALGYNNLGINLILVGEWQRAQEALERALALASEIDERGAKVPTILDSLAELHLLRGNLDDAQSLLERAVALANTNGNKWYAGQAFRTLGRCLLALEDFEGAIEKGKKALELAEQIGDRQAVCESRLLVGEAYLMCGMVEESTAELRQVEENTSDSATDLGISGEAQRLSGKLAMARANPAEAAQLFGRSASIFDMLGDRYRSARAHYELGCAYSQIQPRRASEHLLQAIHTFSELGAALDLGRAEKAVAALDENASPNRNERSALSQLLTLRLAEATASRELLLRELAAVINQETKARVVIVFEPGDEDHNKVVVSHGCSVDEASEIASGFNFGPKTVELAPGHDNIDAEVITLRSTSALPAVLLISPKSAANLSNEISIEPLLRVVELGMDVCALRSKGGAGRGQQEQSILAGASLLPGFIHSSPAMTQLVEEVHKIRSSDVTVLVTGESGTGKELVARAIHAISSRRSKVFLPFNCTAVPKELAESYLFGYKKGAFTGAVSESPGVIRSAAGGTLFLDEIGDLPIDVQPKLLRFLQEGEVQPLGEQRPIQVDVRIIAATNTNLEEMVADGRFREDLYYRLNVIRLRVPPLRERHSEVPAIVNYYVNHYSAKFGRRDITITSQAVDLLMVFDWPGNVRQLTNEIQRVVARAEDGTVITPDQLSPDLRRMSTPVSVTNAAPKLSAVPGAQVENLTLAEAMSELERRMIADAMRKHGGNISRVARELGLTRRGLYLKLERYDLSASA